MSAGVIRSPLKPVVWQDFRLDRFRREMEANREARIRATEIADAGRHPEQCSDSPESDSDKLDSDEEVLIHLAPPIPHSLTHNSHTVYNSQIHNKSPSCSVLQHTSCARPTLPNSRCAFSRTMVPIRSSLFFGEGGSRLGRDIRLPLLRLKRRLRGR